MTKTIDLENYELVPVWVMDGESQTITFNMTYHVDLKSKALKLVPDKPTGYLLKPKQKEE